jgi:hypothetical protein
MKTFGPLYVGKLKYYHKKFLPIIETGKTQETDMPYRYGHCLVFRCPFTIPGFYAGILFKTVKNPHLLTDEDIDLIIAKAMVGRTAWTPEDGLFDEVFKEE